jgi:membrane-bound ClpP family serine protease
MDQVAFLSNWAVIALFYLFGIGLLVAELFLPAGGLIGIFGAMVVSFALYQTYQHSELGGLIGLIIVAVLWPTITIYAIRNWHRTAIGRAISPPNPEVTEKDRAEIEHLRSLLGKKGKTLTMHRPVGMCLFDGHRVECTSEHGIIEAGIEVEALRLIDRTLCIRPVAQANSDWQPT